MRCTRFVSLWTETTLCFALCVLWIVSIETLAISVESSTTTCTNGHNVLILGYGPVARAVSRKLMMQRSSLHHPSWEITATTRKIIEPSSSVQPNLIVFSPESIRVALQTCSHLLVTIPAPKKKEDSVGDSVRRKVEACIAECLGPNTWVGLVSTTGVYGNHDNAWVTEDTECASPDHPYLAYEETWRTLLSSVGNRRFRIFRCAGLYGPDRSALHTVYRKGYEKRTSMSRSVLTNRIHEDDVARAIVASMIMSDEAGAPLLERTYNLADDEPESRAVVMSHAVDLLESIGAVVPEIAEDTASAAFMSPRARRRVGGTAERKRVSNDRCKQELVKEWKYPTYREGLVAILNLKSSPWQATGSSTGS